MSASSKPIPIALPNELLGEIDAVAEKLNLTRAELMRLSMRIGLAEIGAVAEPLTKTVARETERLGITFADWVRSKQQQAATQDLIKAGTVVSSRAADRHATHSLNEDPTPYITANPEEPLTGHYKGFVRDGELVKKLSAVSASLFSRRAPKKDHRPARPITSLKPSDL